MLLTHNIYRRSPCWGFFFFFFVPRWWHSVMQCVASLGSSSARCCSMIQLCRIDLHLTLAILPNQMDVWQPEHTLDTQACVHASDNSHTHADSQGHTGTYTLSGKGYNAAWNKGADGWQWYSANTGKVVKICICVCVCVWICPFTSQAVFTGVMFSKHQSQLLPAECSSVFVLAC